MFFRAVAVLVLGVAGSTLACTGHRPAAGHVSSADRFGVYRLRLVDSGESPRKARMLLFAARPDRVHVEVLPPVGGPQLILDAGGGRLAVTLTGQGTAWVGEAREEVLERIVGFRVTLEELVGAVLDGTPLGGPVEVHRIPESGAGLPRSFELRIGGRALQLELQGTRRRGEAGYAIGTGTPPPRVEVRPLESLAGQGGPLLFSARD